MTTPKKDAAPETAAIHPPSPKSEFETVMTAARLASPVIDGFNGDRHVFVPGGFTLTRLQDPHALPPRIPATGITVDERGSLTQYVNRFSSPASVLVADYDGGTIRALLDYHSSNQHELAAGACGHVAVLKMRDSEEFARWKAAEGAYHKQDEFAAFLEENASDVCDPEPSVLIEISKDLEATQGVTFKSSVRLENGDRAFVYETETHTRGEMKVPREFVLSIPLYHGEAPVPVRCAFRWKIGAGGLLLGFVWRRVEYQRQASFRQVAVLAAEETGLPVYFGRQGI